VSASNPACGCATSLRFRALEHLERVFDALGIRLGENSCWSPIRSAGNVLRPDWQDPSALLHGRAAAISRHTNAGNATALRSASRRARERTLEQRHFNQRRHPQQDRKHQAGRDGPAASGTKARAMRSSTMASTTTRPVQAMRRRRCQPSRAATTTRQRRGAVLQGAAWRSSPDARRSASTQTAPGAIALTSTPAASHCSTR